MLHALPEQPSPKKGRNYTILLIALVDSSLILALILLSPLLAGPASRSSTSFDWAGYSVALDLNSPQPLVTRINASWTVPTVKVSMGNSLSATWVGVGGQFDDTLIQAGTEQDSINGQGAYSAWYELLPHNAVTVDSLNVSSGDKVTASVSLQNPSANVWSIEIHDVTDGQSFQKSVFYASSMLSAEWIVERPTINNRVSTLADFGEIPFTGCTATIGGKSGTINSFPHIQVTMYNRQNVELASVSSFASQGLSFTVSFLG